VLALGSGLTSPKNARRLTWLGDYSHAYRRLIRYGTTERSLFRRCPRGIAGDILDNIGAQLGFVPNMFKTIASNPTVP
jgi:hypothetical protein